ncbi:MAG: Uma2 family endonuclease [Acidobacteria bacterium]|jgi:Uma2 family endonuclease|nr:Uma2 family endonuclease [Acidobacteriota bacterium]
MSTAVKPDSILFTFDVRPLKMTDKTFYEFCQRNKNFRFEMDKKGNLIIMPPTFLETSRKNAKINVRLGIWAEEDKTGIAFESNGMFTLPNGAKRAPDASWILKEKYFALSREEREEQFARIIPDFVIELRSKSDNLRKLQNKMREYIENGVRLGWLIDPTEKRVHIYRADKTIEILENSAKVSGEDVLLGFELDLTEIW